MKRLLTMLFFLPIVFALDCSHLQPNYMGSAAISYSAGGDFDFTFQSSQSKVEYLHAEIRVVPQANTTNAAYTGTLVSEPYSSSKIYYSKDLITQSSLLTSPATWSYNATIHTSSSNAKIETNPSFPYDTDNFPQEVKHYLEFTESADINDAILQKSNELVSGITDYFDAVAVLANFVAHYVNYDYSCAASQACSQLKVPSTQVFASRTGVCDEFSSLLASMLRSVGIPARFESGFVFTNLGEQTCSNFGAHSWTEAYIPGYGWVPLDATYKEFFWINSGHVALYFDDDANANIINVSYLASMATAEVGAQNFNFELQSYNIPVQELQLSAGITPAIVGNSDYVLLNVSIDNPYDEWVLDTLFVDTTESVTLVYNNNSIPVVLPPNTASNYYFVFSTPSSLEAGYIYTNPVIVRLGSGGYQFVNITINPSLDVPTSYADFVNQIGVSERHYNPNIEVFNEEILPLKVTTEQPVLSFDIENTGNTPLSGVTVSVTYGSIAVNESLGSLLISETKHYAKNLTLPENAGVVTVNVNVASGALNESFTKSFTVVTAAPFNFTLSGVEDYSSNSSYSLGLHFSSIPGDYGAANLKILVNNNEVINQPFFFSQSSVSLPKSAFVYGENTITAIIEYSDASGNAYLATDTLNVTSSIQRGVIDSILLFFQSIIDIFKILLGL